jgi:hypothetical protein
MSERRSPAELIVAQQRRIDQLNAESNEPASALAYVQDVYRGRRVADPWRMRAAIAALPFESPKLAVTAFTTDTDFGERLERALARSFGRMRMIEHRNED